jgi:hypothetical protein
MPYIELAAFEGTEELDALHAAARFFCAGTVLRFTRL